MKPVRIDDSYAPRTHRIVEALINHLIEKGILDEAAAKDIIDIGKRTSAR